MGTFHFISFCASGERAGRVNLCIESQEIKGNFNYARNHSFRSVMPTPRHFLPSLQSLLSYPLEGRERGREEEETVAMLGIILSDLSSELSQQRPNPKEGWKREKEEEEKRKSNQSETGMPPISHSFRSFIRTLSR